MQNKRLNWIDSIKGLGIFLVTLGHLKGFPPLEMYIYSFHMPLFFFISGYLHRCSNISICSSIAKKFSSLFVPFLCWNILSTLFDIFNGENINITLEKFLIIDGKLCWNTPIWFLLVLFLTEILFIAIEKFQDNLITKLFLLIISLIIWLQIGHLTITFKLNLVPLAMIFYCAGCVVKVFETNHAITTSRTTLALILIFSATLNLIFIKINGVRVVYTYGKFGTPLYFLIAAFSGIVFYFTLFKSVNFIGDCKILSLLGKNSLIIMATQFWFFRLYDVLSYHFLDCKITTIQNTLKAFVLTILTIAITLLFVKLIKHLYPKNKSVKMIGQAFGIR